MTSDSVWQQPEGLSRRHPDPQPHVRQHAPRPERFHRRRTDRGLVGPRTARARILQHPGEDLPDRCGTDESIGRCPRQQPVHRPLRVRVRAHRAAPRRALACPSHPVSHAPPTGLRTPFRMRRAPSSRRIVSFRRARARTTQLTPPAFPEETSKHANCRGFFPLAEGCESEKEGRTT